MKRIQSKEQLIASTVDTIMRKQQLSLPHIFKSNSWTKAAPIKEEPYNRSVADSIGNNYSPLAAKLSAKTLKKRHAVLPSIPNGNNSYSSEAESRPMSPETRKAKHCQIMDNSDLYEKPQVPKDVFQKLDPVELLSPMERYLHYIQLSISDDEITMPTEKEIGRVIKRIPLALRSSEKSIVSLKAEIVKDFCMASKKAIVDYILLDPQERKRLMVPHVPYLYISPVLRTPVPWHDSWRQAKEEMEKYLFVTNPVVAEIKRIFHDFDSTFIRYESFCTPNTLLTHDDFLRNVRIQCTNFRSRLIEEWLGKIATYLYHSKDKWYKIASSCQDLDEGFSRLDCFFRSLSSLMGSHLWAMTQTALNDFESFLCKLDGIRPHCVFTSRLEIDEQNIVISPTEETLEMTLAKCVDEIVATSSNLHRVETKLFSSLAEEKLFVNSMSIAEARQNRIPVIRKVIREYWISPSKYVQSFDKFKPLLLSRTARRMEVFLKEEHSLEDYEVELVKLITMTKDVQYRPNSTKFPLVAVDCTALKEELASRAIGLQKVLIDHIAETNRKVNTQNCESYDRVANRVAKVPSDTEEIIDLLKFIEAVKVTDLVKLEEEIESGKKRLDFLLTYATLSDDDLKVNGITFTWTSRIFPILDLNRKRLMQRKAKAADDLKVKTATTFDDINDIHDIVNRFQDYGMLSDLAEYMKKLRAAQNRLKEIEKIVASVHKEETLLECPVTTFEKFNITVEMIEPYRKMWETATLFQSRYALWMNGPLSKISATEVSEQTNNMAEVFSGLAKTFGDYAIQRKFADALRLRLEKFKPNLPLIIALRNPALKESHWQKMATVIGQEISVDTTTFSKLLDFNISQFLQQIEEISVSATKEQETENAFNRLKAETENATMTLVDYGDTGTKIVLSLTELQSFLDGQIVSLQELLSSPYSKQSETQIREWHSVTTRIKEILSLEIQVQAMWITFDTIFSEDFVLQIPAEGQKFRAVDTLWREYILEVVYDTHLLRLLEEKTKERLSHLKATMDDIELAVVAFLDNKGLPFVKLNASGEPEAQEKTPYVLKQTIIEEEESSEEVKVIPDVTEIGDVDKISTDTRVDNTMIESITKETNITE